MSYLARRRPELETITLRGLDFQLYRWAADPARVPVLLLHGWGDVGATWQFLVDELDDARVCIAVDQRGFGRTQWAPGGYWFPDYLADLDALLRLLSPNAPIDLIGHSMGGNVAMLYAGVRPQRVRRLVNLEGFGLSRTSPQQAPARYAQWLDELEQGTRYATYDSYDHFVRLLARRNPRTPADRLELIARAWGCERPDGSVELRADPAHKRVNPVLYQHDQAQACWRKITAPVLVVSGGVSHVARRHAEEGGEQALRDSIGALQTALLPGAGHMLHHEQPRELAELIEPFLGAAFLKQD